MTKHIVQLPNSDGSLLLRELNHRIKNELTSAIYAVSAKAVRSESVAVKAALLDVVDLLHHCADVHRSLHMPDQGRLTDAARYLQQLCFSITKYQLDRLGSDRRRRPARSRPSFDRRRVARFHHGRCGGDPCVRPAHQSGSGDRSDQEDQWAL
jgi:two-component sensor histidine kinase